MKNRFINLVIIILLIMSMFSCATGKGSKEREVGKKYYRQADYENSIKHFSAAIKKDPEYWELYYYRSLSYQKLQNTDLAINDLSMIIELLPKIRTWNFKFPADKWADIYVMRGMLYHQKIKYESAITDFNKALELNPKNKGAYYYRALVKKALGTYQEALKDYTQAINLASKFMSGVSDTAVAQAYLDRADIYRKLNKLDLALADNNQVLSIVETWVAFLSRGTTLAKKEMFERAIKDFDKAIESNPSAETAYLYRASSRLLLNCNLNKTLKDLYAVTNIKNIDDDTKQLSYNQIAWILATAADNSIRDGKKALQYAKKSVMIKSDFRTLDTLAVAYAEGGKYDQAISIVEQAIDLCKSNYPELLPEIEKHLESFSLKKPIREKCPGVKVELEQLHDWQKGN